jgi:hypothetical protein
MERRIVRSNAAERDGMFSRVRRDGKLHARHPTGILMQQRRKTLLFALILLAWFSALTGAFLWFNAQYIRAFQVPLLEERTAEFKGELLRLPAALTGPGPIRLVHFWDPICPCNLGNQQHLAELMRTYARRGVHFYLVQKPGTQGRLPEDLKALEPLTAMPGVERLPVSPAVAIWDRQGNLAYFGPYSEGATCNAGNSFIEPVLEALVAGRQVKATNTVTVGCYCAWSAEGS